MNRQVATRAAAEMRGKRASAIFTACSANYLTKALAMCRSALQHNPVTDVVVLLVDRKRPVAVNDPRIRILWAEDLGFPNFLHCAFKYNIIELNTALKPFAAMRLLEEYRKVVYLDPDVCVFSAIDPVLQALDESPAVFTPHALSPYAGKGRPSDQDLLRFGACNLGFFAVDDSAQARALLSWWHTQCLSLCYYEPQLGLGVDQKWIDLASSFFEGVRILRHPGLNVAFWNLHERAISRSGSAWVVNGETPLVFIHFSSFVVADASCVADKQTRHAPGTRPDFTAAAEVYRLFLREAEDLATLETTYGFAAFDNGSVISPMLRRMYAVHETDRFADCPDPFMASGPVHAFARQHGLSSSRPASTQHQNFKVASAYRKEQRAITFVFRVILRVLGPDRYFALMRYLGHYSSTLNQADLLRP